MNPRAWRITTWWGKLIFVFGAWLVADRLLEWAFGLLGVAHLASAIVFIAYDVGVLLLGARIFRGRGELVSAPRPWWQMTSRQKLSNNLGSWLAVLTALAAVSFVISIFSPVGVSPLDAALAVAYFGIPAYLYLNSAARLKPAPKPDPLPTVVQL